MKTKILRNIFLNLGVILALAAVLPVQLTFGRLKAPPPRYKLVDLGTFGGPNSFFDGGPLAGLNNGGIAAGQADTSTPCSLVDLVERRKTNYARCTSGWV